MKEFVERLHGEGMHFVLIFDPAISNTQPPASYPTYDRALAADVFIKSAVTGRPFQGKVKRGELGGAGFVGWRQFRVCFRCGPDWRCSLIFSIPTRLSGGVTR